MSDPFFGLNINNLQTISATNNKRLQEMSHSITKPLMSSHLPQLPQQQMRPMAATHSKTQTAEEELDDRKKFEKYRKFQLQQKKLQEMSFSKTVPSNTNSSADKLMANLIQKVESDAKLDKRINNSHKSGHNVYNQQSVHTSMATNVVHNSGPPVLTPNTSSYANQYTNVGHMSATIPPVYMSGQQLPQQQTNNYFKSYYLSNPIQKTSVQQMTNSGLESLNQQMSADMDRLNQNEKVYNYLPQTTTNQSISSSSIQSLNSNSEPIFSISSINGINPGVTHSNREPTSSVLSPPVFRKLPNCFEDLSKIPALYIRVWNYVKTNDISNVCDTTRLYPVLLSVGLPQTTLAKLWSVVNQTIPGQLTRHELNMALALIALIQKSSPNPLEEIYRLESLPVPAIHNFSESNEGKASFEVLKISNESEVKPLSVQTSNINSFEQNISNQKDFSPQDYEKSEQILPNMSSDNSVFADTVDDDFDDFKSADFSSISREEQTIPELKTKTTSQPLTETAVNNNTTEEEFDNFKSVSFGDLNQSIPSTESTKSQTVFKTNTLSDALISNISAISSPINSHTMSPTPIVTISSLNSMSSSTNSSSQNTLASSPQSIEATDHMSAFNANFGSLDRYSVFRELSAENKKEDDFGNFLSYTTNCDAESVDSLHMDSDNNDTIESISHQIIQTCRQLIHKTFNVLVVNHGEDSVLEAIGSSDGSKFAFDILEVYAIVKRVEKNLKTSDKLNTNLIKLIEDIDNTWNSISSVFTKASLDIVFDIENKDITENDNNCTHCAICNSKPSAERPVLKFAGFEYHTSCANLWLNCINPTLPQPLINCR